MDLLRRRVICGVVGHCDLEQIVTHWNLSVEVVWHFGVSSFETAARGWRTGRRLSRTPSAVIAIFGQLMFEINDGDRFVLKFLVFFLQALKLNLKQQTRQL